MCSTGIDATFDDANLVANAGLLLVSTLSQRLGPEGPRQGAGSRKRS